MPISPPLVRLTSIGGTVTLTPTDGVGVVNLEVAGGTSGGFLPGYLLVAPTAGVHNNFNPGAPWPTGIGRLDIDTSAGNIELTGLVAGTPGQMVLIRNVGANNLQLDNNGASSAGNVFASNGNLIVLPNGRTLAVWYGGTVNKWSVG